MRAIGIIGYKNTGKTTLICKILEKLSQDKNLKIASVKHSNEKYNKDHNENSDSYKFKKNSRVVILSTENDTTLYYDKLSLKEIISRLELNNYDFVIIEGFKEQLKELNIPKIVMVKEDEGLELCDKHTIKAIYNCKYDIEEIIKLVLEKSTIPTYNLNCGNCNFNCNLFVEEVIKGNAKWDDCVMESGVKLTVNGETIPLKPFVADLFKNTLEGITKSLKIPNENINSINISIVNNK